MLLQKTEYKLPCCPTIPAKSSRTPPSETPLRPAMLRGYCRKIDNTGSGLQLEIEYPQLRFLTHQISMIGWLCQFGDGACPEITIELCSPITLPKRPASLAAIHLRLMASPRVSARVALPVICNDWMHPIRFRIPESHRQSTSQNWRSKLNSLNEKLTDLSPERNQSIGKRSR